MVERLFFALWPSRALRASLVQARAALPGAPGRPTHPADLHLTLVFVGAAEPHLHPCIEAAGDDVVADAFELTLGRLTNWSGGGFWAAEPEQPPSALFALVNQLQQNLLVCGVEPEQRRYRPHVTLARKAPAIAPAAVAMRWPVTDFVLAASRSGQKPSYSVRRRWPLGA
jgi:2'-5' RNA ligase